MKTTVTISGMEEKTSKQGRKYKSFDLGSHGKASCFESKAEAELVKNIGKPISVEIEERNGFKNITKFYGLGEETINPQQGQQLTAQSTEPTFRISIKQTAKGFAYWDVSIRADTADEAKTNLEEAISLAGNECMLLNESQPVEPADEESSSPQ